jgi:O-antigen ligase
VTASGLAFALLAITTTGPIAPMGIATALCGALTLLALAPTRPFAWPRTPVDRAAFAWFAALVLAAWFAQDRAASLPRIAKGFFPLLVGLAAFHGGDRRTAERALAALLAASGVVALLGVGLWAAHGATFEGRARGLSGHYMTFAGQLLLELPVAIAIAACARRRAWRIGAGLVALAGLAALAVTFTRSAWIGLLVELAVILGALLPLGLVGLAALVAAAFAFAPGAYRARLYSIFDPHHPWNQQRVYMWDAGRRMFLDHPWTGVGLQDLHPLYDRYRAAGSTERAGHLHNVFVQIAATMGVAGLAAFGWLYASFLRAAAAGMRAQLRRRGLAAGVRLGVLAALAGFLAAGLFEWNFGDEELLYPLYMLVGLAWAARRWDHDEG